MTPNNRKSLVFLREPGPQDCEAFVAAVQRSRSLHQSWVSPPDNPQAFGVYLERLATDYHYGFLVIRRSDEQFVGLINLNNVIRGAFQSAFLGYYAFKPLAGQGLMGQGMRLVIRHAFAKLKLHRLEANVQPANLRSIGLLRKCGFHREGFSPRYLKVAGQWRDHERWAILCDEKTPGSNL